MRDAGESTKGLYRIAKWARNREDIIQGPFIPPLCYVNKTLAISAKDKAEVLFKEYFPSPFKVDLRDIPGY